MAGIDLNKYYQSLISSGYDPVEAAQIAAYQYIDNPSGSITKIKKPPKWYTYDDYLNYSAPDYLAAIKYQGDDELALKSRDLLANPDTTLVDVAAFARANRRGDMDVYSQLKDLYDQRESARKGYEKQVEGHEFTQYGLPDPTLRYSAVAGTRKDAKGKNVTYVAYQPAVEYIDKKLVNYYNQLRASGLDEKQAQQSIPRLRDRLVAEVDKKIAAASISPFLDKVAELRKIKK